MESSDPRKLTGMARMVDALFSEPPPASAVSEVMVWEAVEDESPAGPQASAADPEALRSAVTAFLESDRLQRRGKGRAVRTEAAALREANALGVLAESVERLAREAGDPPDEAAVAMARALLTPGVGERLAARLGEDRDEARRADLLTIARRLGGDMIQSISEALSSTEDRFTRHSLLDAMVALGDHALPVVQRMLEDGRWFVVRNGVAILGEIGGERAVELVVSTLAHGDARVRREAVLALAKVGGEDAGMLVYGMIEDPDPEVRLAAAMAAGELKVERALKPLLALLEEETEPDVIVGVLHALGQLGDPSAVNAIEKRAVTSFFSRRPTAIRIAAYRALYSIRTPRAKSLLVQAAIDKDPEVKALARELLGMR